MNRKRSRFRLAAAALTLSLTAAGVAALPATAAEPTAASNTNRGAAKPTIVLVHGAFADSSGWSIVGGSLEASGYPVIAFSNPLRGVDYDSQYLRDFLNTITGPIVLVGHSYGGALITNAATGNPNVKSLVYIAAYALDEGETVEQANKLGGGTTEVTQNLIFRPFPGATDMNADAYINPTEFPRLFAQDVPKAVAKQLAASQRPGALASLVTPSGEPAWKTIPSWYMVAENDRIIPPEAERAMAARANATTVEVNTSHLPLLSKPGAVINLIKQAAK